MNEAPERIYSGPSVDDKGVFWDVGHWDKEPDEGCIEYVRADRIEELKEQLAKAVEALSTLADCVDDGCFCSEMEMATAMDKARTTLAQITGGKDD